MDLVGVIRAYNGPAVVELDDGEFSDEFSTEFAAGSLVGEQLTAIYCGTVCVWPDPWTNIWDEGFPVTWENGWRDLWSVDLAPPAVEEE